MGGVLRLLTAVLALLLGACSLLVDVGVRDRVGDDGGAGDGGPDPDAGPCGTIGRFQDEFTGTALSSQWVATVQGTAAATPTISGGELTLGFAQTPSVGDEFSEVESNFSYDVRDRALTVRASDPDQMFWTTVELRGVERYGTRRRIVGMGRLGPDLAAFTDGSGFEVTHSVPFDAAAHRHWRIREAAGILELEVAGDDRRFSSFTTVTDSGIDPSTVAIGLSAFVGMPPELVSGTIAFDDVNAGEVVDPACPIGDLRDDFTAASLGPLWTTTGDVTGCSLETGAGLALSATAGARCEVASAHAYSIAGGREIVLDMGAFPGDANAEITVRLLRDADNYLEVRQKAGILTVDLVELGVARGAQSLTNAGGRQWWRVRERDGALELATSADGTDFGLRHTVVPLELDLSELRVSFALEVTAAASATLGSVNLIP